MRADYGMSGITAYGYTFQQVVADSGLMDYKARAYDPFLQKFIQPDAVVAEPGSSQGYNRYAYVNNDPVNLADPSGNRACEKIDQNGKCIADKEWTNNSLDSSMESSTIAENAINGDLESIIKLITPTHIGGRTEAFICWLFGCAGFGANIVYNFTDNQTVINIDTMLSGGAAPQEFMPKLGVFASVGPLIGWGSSSIENVTSGLSAQFSEFAAAKFGMELSISAPTNKGSIWKFILDKPKDGGSEPIRLIEDPIYGVVPITLYIGGGAGVGAGLGGGLVTTQSRENIIWGYR